MFFQKLNTLFLIGDLAGDYQFSVDHQTGGGEYSQFYDLNEIADFLYFCFYAKFFKSGDRVVIEFAAVRTAGADDFDIHR